MWGESNNGPKSDNEEDGTTQGKRQISVPIKYPYYWRVKTRLPERKGQKCRVLVRGKLNNALVEFEDGYRIITSRNYMRKRDGK